MLVRVDKENKDRIPKAKIESGVALCPVCWQPLGEPISGGGEVAVWCRKCKAHRVIRY